MVDGLKTKALLAWMSLVSAVSAQSGTTLGIVGVTRISIPPAGGVVLVGFNYTSSDPLYLEDVFGADQLVSSTRSRSADKVYIWNGTSYDNYFQKPDGLFYDVLTGVPVTREISHGTAMFLQSPTSAILTNDVFLSGAVLMDDFSPKGYPASFTTFANPYPTDLNLNDSSLDWSDATANNRSKYADKLYIWNAGTSEYDAFYLDGNRIWQVLISSIPNPVIPIGGGAFYEARVTFTNDIFKPFN